MRTYRYLISGLVQGVCFRHYTVCEAERLGISGTVKNLASGDVEVFAQGDEAAIAQFLSFLNRGPFTARIDQLVKEEFESTEEYRGFDIKW